MASGGFKALTGGSSDVLTQVLRGGWGGEGGPGMSVHPYEWKLGWVEKIIIEIEVKK